MFECVHNDFELFSFTSFNTAIVIFENGNNGGKWMMAAFCKRKIKKKYFHSSVTNNKMFGKRFLVRQNSIFCLSNNSIATKLKNRSISLSVKKKYRRLSFFFLSRCWKWNCCLYVIAICVPEMYIHFIVVVLYVIAFPVFGFLYKCLFTSLPDIESEKKRWI